MPCTWDQATTSAVAAQEPVVIRARPPWRSSHRPTGTAIAAPASTEAGNAPVTVAGRARRAAALGLGRPGQGRDSHPVPPDPAAATPPPVPPPPALTSPDHH